MRARVIALLLCATWLGSCAIQLVSLRRQTCISESNCSHITVGLLMPNPADWSVATHAAVQVAVDDINAQNTSGRPIRFISPGGSPYGCTADVDLAGIRHLMNNGADFIVGPGCSTKDSIVNWVADHADIGTISFRDIHRTNGERHPTMGRLNVPVIASAPQIVDLVLSMGWKKVALVQDNRLPWYGCTFLVPAVKNALQAAGVKIALHINLDETRFTVKNYTKYALHSGARKLRWDLVAKLIRPRARVVLYCGFPGFESTTSLMASRQFLLGVDGHLGDISEYAFVLLHVDRGSNFTAGIAFNSTRDRLNNERAKRVFENVLVVYSPAPRLQPSFLTKLRRHIKRMQSAPTYMQLLGTGYRVRGSFSQFTTN